MMLAGPMQNYKMMLAGTMQTNLDHWIACF